MKYNKAIETICKKFDGDEYRRKDSLKAYNQLRLTKDKDELKVYHYGTYIGGVRFDGDKTLVKIGYPVNPSDATALNTVWRHYRTGKRMRMALNGEYWIERVNEEKVR